MDDFIPSLILIFPEPRLSSKNKAASERQGKLLAIMIILSNFIYSRNRLMSEGTFIPPSDPECENDTPIDGSPPHSPRLHSFEVMDTNTALSTYPPLSLPITHNAHNEYSITDTTHDKSFLLPSPDHANDADGWDIASIIHLPSLEKLQCSPLSFNQHGRSLDGFGEFGKYNARQRVAYCCWSRLGTGAGLINGPSSLLRIGTTLCLKA